MRYTDEDFNHDDEDYDFDEAEAEMMADAFAQSQKTREEQFSIVKRQLDHDLLEKAISMSKGWFWGLLPHPVKCYMIAKSYELLIKLIN